MSVHDHKDGLKEAYQRSSAKWKVKDVADYYGVKPSTVYQWVANEKLPVERTPGGHLRFDPDVIQKKEAPANG